MKLLYHGHSCQIWRMGPRRHGVFLVFLRAWLSVFKILFLLRSIRFSKAPFIVSMSGIHSVTHDPEKHPNIGISWI